jgi:hypothetical protein
MPLIAATLLAVGGWIVPWQHDAGLAAVERARGGLGDVFLFAAQLDADGHPVLDGSAEAWAGTIRRVHDRGARAWLTVVNDLVSAGTSATLKDADIVHRLIADADARAAHSREIVALAKSLNVDGLDLDYENLPASERDAFTAFVGRLAADLHASELSLSVTVQPKRRETSSKGPGAADWRRICAVVDRMQVMLYNQHNAATGAGPIADLDWIGGIVDYGLDTCPASKLVPVVKVSGMDWGPAKARKHGKARRCHGGATPASGSEPRCLEGPRNLGDEIVHQTTVGFFGVPGAERELPARDLDLADGVRRAG